MQSGNQATLDLFAPRNPPTQPTLFDEAIARSLRRARVLRHPTLKRLYGLAKRLQSLRRMKHNLEMSLANWPTKKREQPIQSTLFDDAAE